MTNATPPYYFLPENAPENFVASVMAVTYVSPSEHYNRIEMELISKGVPEGDVLFDLLLSNASRGHRYFLVPFTGMKFRMNGTRKVPRTPELEAWSRNAFQTCPVPLDTVLLLSEELMGLL